MNHAKLKTPATKPAGSRRGGRAPNAETRAAMAEVDSMLRGRRATHEPKFTRAEQQRIRAHVIARGMTFKVFLPESLAKALVQRGILRAP
jgi:hypothetical protein